MFRRVVAAVLVMLLCLVYAPAGVARASSSPWVPPSFGSGEDVRAVFSGGGAPGAGWSAQSVGEGVGTYCTRMLVAWDEGGSGGRTTGKMWLGFDVVHAAGGSWTQAECEKYNASSNAERSCDGGATWHSAPGAWYIREGGRGWVSFDACSGSVMSRWRGGMPGTIKTRDWQATGGLASTVELVCASSTGTVRLVSGVGSSPSVSCGSGETAIGATVSRGGQTVGSWAIPDTTPELAGACMSGECRPKVTLGGYSCDPTMAVGTDPDWCRRAGNGGSLPADSGCEWTHPTLGVIALTKADCASWLEGVAGPPVPEPEEHDSGVIVEWLQRILDAINRVKSSVDAVRDAVQSGLSGVVSAVDAVRSAIEGMDTGGDGGTGVGPGPGSAPGPHGAPGDLAAKFDPWFDLWSSMTGAGFGAPASSCKGPATVLELGGRSHTVYLLDACGPRADLAATSRVVMSVALVFVAVLATIRVLASALGLQLKMGE